MTWLKRLFHRMGSPMFFYRGSRPWMLWFYLVGAVALVVGSIYGLFFVPPEKYQGESFRIMYVHVPSAHLSQLVYIAIAIAGVVHLVWRMKMADVFMKAAAPVGLMLTAVALVSGILWGIPTWGTGWVWDARTTSMLFLLFLFVGLILLREVVASPSRASTAVSILAIVGVLNIPIIKYSVEWFTTLHQPASIQLGKPVSIATTFLWPLLINITGLYIFVAAVIVAQMRNELLYRERHTQWVRAELRLSS